MPREEIRSDRSTSQAGSEFFNTLQEMSRDWMTRATAEVELSLKLSTRLLMSSGQKFMDASSRLLSSNWMSASTTT